MNTIQEVIKYSSSSPDGNIADFGLAMLMHTGSNPPVQYPDCDVPPSFTR